MKHEVNAMKKLITVLIALTLCALAVPAAFADSYVPASGSALRSLHPSRMTPNVENRSNSYFSPAMYGVKRSRKAKSFENLMALRAAKAETKQAKHEYRFKVTPPPRVDVYGLPAPKPAVATASGNPTAETVEPQSTTSI